MTHHKYRVLCEEIANFLVNLEIITSVQGEIIFLIYVDGELELSKVSLLLPYPVT